jgi:hypothetical protein
VLQGSDLRGERRVVAGDLVGASGGRGAFAGLAREHDDDPGGDDGRAGEPDAAPGDAGDRERREVDPVR